MILIRRIFSVLLVSLLFVVPAFAAEGPEVVPPDEEFPDLSSGYVPYSYQQVYALPDNARIITAEDLEPSGVDVSVQALDPIKPSNSNGLKAILLNILGDYSAITVEYRYTNSNGTYNYLREVQPDYVWMGSALLFIVLIWCTFKLGGAILCKK